MGRIRAGLGLVSWIGLLGVALTALHRLGASLPAGSILENEFEFALAASLRLVGLGAGYWLLVVTLTYLISSLVRFPAGLRAVGVATVPWVRKLTDRLVSRTAARTLVAALAAPLPIGDLVDPGYVPIPAGDPLSPTTATTAPATTVVLPPAVIPTAPIVEVVPLEPAVEPVLEPADTTGELEVAVRRGDHMWGLAESRLASELGRPPTDQEIAPYWVRVVETNRGRIRSGDPDLIYPGEILVLPAL